MRTSMIAMLGMTSTLLALHAAPAQGQLFGRMKEMAARKLAEATAERVAKATRAGGATIDSTVDRGGRKFDSAVVHTGESLRATVKSESAGEVVPPGDSVGVSRLANDLASGRLALDALRFDDGDRLDAASSASLRSVARAMKGTSGGYVVKVKVSASVGAQQLADRRAAAIRSILLAEGIEGERLYSAGSGSTGAASSRAEILRIK